MVTLMAATELLLPSNDRSNQSYYFATMGISILFLVAKTPR